MSKPSLALRTVLSFKEAVDSAKLDLLASFCDESTFVQETRPASLHMTRKNLSEWKDFLSMFATIQQVFESEIYEVQKGENTVIILRTMTSATTVSGVDVSGEVVHTFEVNQGGLIVSHEDFYDSKVLSEFFKKLGILALRTVLKLSEVFTSGNWEALSTLCDESSFVAIIRPASLNLPAKNFSEYKAYLSGFDTMSQEIVSDEIYELQKGDKTVVIYRSVNSASISGVSVTREIISTFEVNHDGLIVSVTDFYDSQVLSDFFAKLGI
ncbi:hypothetical protein HDU98_009636 [Podochytrium sp. JEL0797]|nr:hypothetical protein HDU98_009636 [Podochytrium sp. JEL0797]